MGDVDQTLWHPSAWSSHNRAYGVSGSSDHAVVVRRDQRGSGETLYVGPMDPENGDWRKVLQDMRAEQGACEAWVVSALPADQCILRWLRTPLKDKSKARKVLPGLLDLEIPFKLDDFRYFFLQLSDQASGAYAALAAAARVKEVTARRASLHEASVDIDLLDAESLGLWQGISSKLGDAPSLVIDVSAERSLLLVADATTLHFQLPVSSGVDDIKSGAGATFVKSIQRALHALPESLNYNHSVWLSGQNAEGQVSELLEQALEKDAEVAYLPDGESCIAQGLAERALQCSDTSLNFLLGEESPSLVQAAQKTLRKWAAVFALTGLACLMATQIWQRSVEKRTAGYQQHITELAAKLSGQTPAQMKAYRGQEVLIATRAMDGRGLNASVFETAVSKGLLPQIADFLDVAGQHGIEIQHLRLSKQNLVIEGSASDWDVSENLLAEGQRQGYTLQLSRDRANSNERIPFRLFSAGEQR